MMVLTSFLRRALSLSRWASAILCAALLVSCGREEIRVYRVPKEKLPEPAPAQAQAHGTPHLHYETPDGWTELPAGGMRAAAFSVPGKDNRKLDVSAIPLPGMGASMEAVVNIWREQVNLPPVNEEEAARLVQEVAIGEGKGELFDIASAEPLTDGQLKRRILVAALKDGSTTWFFKMAGDDESVNEQKAAFLAFLKSVSIDHGSHATREETRFTSTNVKEPPGQRTQPVNTSDAKPVWNIPASWKEVPPTQMVLAKFLVTGEGGKAEITVSSFPGDVGGALANVNRWRGQLGLAPVDQKEMEAMVSSLDVSGGKAILIDMSGQDVKSGQKARLIGAILPRGDRTWFYKLMGDEPIAAGEKAAFTSFVQSAKYPNG